MHLDHDCSISGKQCCSMRLGGRSFTSQSKTARFANCHHDLPVHDFHRVSGNAAVRDMKRFPRGHLVSTAMPATRHDLALHLARSQRRSLVETAIFHGVDRSVDVEERNLPARDGHARACPRREFVQTRCLNEVMHSLSPALALLKCDLCDADPAYHKLRKIGCFLRGLDLGAASCDNSRSVTVRRPPLLSACRVREPVSYTHLRAHETRHDLVCRLLL